MTVSIIGVRTEFRSFVSTGTLKVKPTAVQPTQYAHLTLEDDDGGRAAIVVDKHNLRYIIEELQKHLDAWGDE